MSNFTEDEIDRIWHDLAQFRYCETVRHAKVDGVWDTGKNSVDGKGREGMGGDSQTEQTIRNQESGGESSIQPNVERKIVDLADADCHVVLDDGGQRCVVHKYIHDYVNDTKVCINCGVVDDVPLLCQWSVRDQCNLFHTTHRRSTSAPYKHVFYFNEKIHLADTCGMRAS